MKNIATIMCVALSMGVNAKVSVVITKETLSKKATFYVMKNGSVSKVHIPKFLRISVVLKDEVAGPAGIYAPKIELVKDLQSGVLYAKESHVLIKKDEKPRAMVGVGSPNPWFVIDPSSMSTDQRALASKKMKHLTVGGVKVFMRLLTRYEARMKTGVWPTKKSKNAAKDRYGIRVHWKTREDVVLSG